MTAPQRQSNPPPTAFTPLAEAGAEAPREPSPEIRDALARDQAELLQEVILWQRWVRWGAAVIAGLVIFAVSRPSREALVPLAAVALAYAGLVFATGWFVQRVPATTPRPWLPALLVTADLFVMGALFYLTMVPLVSNRFLILAILSVTLAAFYFGWGLGIYAALLANGIYILIGDVLTPFVDGPRPISLGANIALFSLVSGTLVFTFGRFRARMNQIRQFCKAVEEGDLTGTLDLTRTRNPDDLTLLARSFDAMRNGLAEQIGTDALTGCLNRRALEARLKSDWRLAKRRGTHIALAAIDLDHFKQINDTRGHPVGDVVLQQLAGIMKSTARDTDAVARFGGDEFVILLPDTGWQGALTFAERLRRRVDDFTFGPPGSPMTITISVGVALARGTDPISPEELLKEADRSLYKAKQQGRNRVFA